MQLVSKLKEESRVIDFPNKNQLTEKAIQEYQLPFGADYLRYKLGWSLNFADGAIAEYKRFVIMALRSDKEITPSVAVDEVWHYHILHTKDYAKFAEKIGHFLDHNPGAANEMPRFSRQYEQTLQFYREVFKQEPPVEYWPRQKQTEQGSEDLSSLRVPAVTRENLVQDDFKTPLERELFRSLNELLTLVEDNYQNRKKDKRVSGVCGVNATALYCRKSFFQSFETIGRCLAINVPGKFQAALIIAGIKHEMESKKIYSELVNPVIRPLIKRIEQLGYTTTVHMSRYSTEFIAVSR